jgi:hypothetical protein
LVSLYFRIVKFINLRVVYDYKKSLSSAFLNSCEAAGSLLISHVESHREREPHVSLLFHVEILWRLLLLLLETINIDPALYLSDKESSARRVFAHLKKLQSVSTFKPLEHALKRYSFLITKLNDFVRLDELSRPY